MCVNYAADLITSAEENGIKCGFLLLTFGKNTTSHTLNMFVLEDGQIMYVDLTGSNNTVGKDRCFLDLKIGDEYESMGTVYNMYEYW